MKAKTNPNPGNNPRILYGSKCCDENGKYHRDHGPAVIESNGTMHWYQHGKLHRDSDEPAIIGPYSKEWYQHGKRHRENGPATITAFGEYWFQFGNLHRTDGPAIIRNSPAIIPFEWWVCGIRIYEAPCYRAQTGMSDEQMLIMTLKYGEVR